MLKCEILVLSMDCGKLSNSYDQTTFIHPFPSKTFTETLWGLANWKAEFDRKFIIHNHVQICWKSGE